MKAAAAVMRAATTATGRAGAAATGRPAAMARAMARVWAGAHRLLVRLRRLLRTSAPAARRPALPPLSGGIDLAAFEPAAGRGAGDRATRARGEGIEVDSLRPWTEGDPARAIDWRATARLGEPHVRIRNDDRELPIRIVVDADSVETRPGRAVLRAAAEWLLRSAAAGGQPVGVLLLQGGELRRTVASRGRGGLARGLAVLAGRGPAAEGGFGELLESVPAEGAVLLLGSFAHGPEERSRLHRAAHTLAAGARVLPVRVVETPERLPDAGVLPLDGPGGRRWVDTSDAEVRRRWEEATAAWRASIAAMQAGMAPELRLDARDIGLRAVQSRFGVRWRHSSRHSAGRSGRRSAGWPIRRAPRTSRAHSAGPSSHLPSERPSRTVATSPIALLVALALHPAVAAGQSTPHLPPGSAPEIVSDELPAQTTLGAPVRRILVVRWPGGPERPPRKVEGEIADVRVVESTPLPEGGGAGGDLWRIEVEYRVWQLGEGRLPAAGLDGIAGGTLDLRRRRIRVLPPEAPEAGLGPTVPELPPGAALGWLRAGPLGLAVVGTVLGLASLAGRRRDHPDGAAIPRPDVPRAGPLDPVVAEVRRRLNELAPLPHGWSTRRWALGFDGRLTPEARHLLEHFGRHVDERRFRPGDPTPEEVRAARETADRFLAAAGEAE